MRKGAALPAWGCALAVAVVFFLTWPFAELPFNDDWSYAFTARQLRKRATWPKQMGDGRHHPAGVLGGAHHPSFRLLVYGSAPRHSSVRHGIGRHLLSTGACCGLSRTPAAFASMTMSLGPMFLPLAASFMSDVPGLMFMLLSLYALVRCGESTRSCGQRWWLAAGAASSLLGGMDRQIVWIVSLAVAPYLMVVHRRNAGFLAAAGAAWIIVLVGAVATMRWFNAQPYAIPEPPLRQSLERILDQPQRLWQTILALWLTTALLALPAMLLAAPVIMRDLLARWKDRQGWIALTLIVLAALFLFRFPRFIEMPWLGNVLTPQGILGKDELIGRRPTILAPWFRQAIGALVWIMTTLVMADLIGSAPHPREAVERLRQRLAGKPLAIPCIGIVAAAYTCVLLRARDATWCSTATLSPWRHFWLSRWFCGGRRRHCQPAYAG